MSGGVRAEHRFALKSRREYGEKSDRDREREALRLDRKERTKAPPPKPMPSRSRVRRSMRMVLADGGVDTATSLVECVNVDLDLPEHWLDDPDHWVWDMGLQEFDTQDRESSDRGAE